MKAPILNLLVLVFLLGSVASILSQTQLHKADLSVIASSIDTVAMQLLSNYSVAGASVAIVREDQIYCKGFGLADAENQRPVDPYQTAFRIASITKTFTAVAALHLVSEGKLNLHQDIRKYLPDEDFDFLSDEKITMHQLLTHTAGFDMTDIGDAAREVRQIKSLEEVVRHNMPKRIYPPGTIHIYSNFGLTLAGYIIECIAGEPYEDYIEKVIFNPLGMNNTTLKQPLPEFIQKQKATGYDDKMVAEEYSQIVPAGGAYASAGDMSQYMRALLGIQHTSILTDSMSELLFSQHYGSKNTEFGICYTFFEGRDLGYRSVYHGGTIAGYASCLIFIPETNIAVFVVQNCGKNKQGVCWNLARKILHLLLLPKSEVHEMPEISTDFQNETKSHAGIYQQIHSPESTFEKARQLFGQDITEFEVKDPGDGTLLIDNRPFVPVEKDLFHILDSVSNWNIEFQRDPEDRIVGFRNGIISYRRIGFFQQNKFIKLKFWGILLILMILFASHMLKTVIPGLKEGWKDKTEKQFLTSLWLTYSTFLYISGIFFIILASLLLDQLTDFGVPFIMKISFTLFSLSALLLILFPYVLYHIWHMKALKISHRIYYSIWIFLLLTMTGILWQHHLIGYQF